LKAYIENPQESFVHPLMVNFGQGILNFRYRIKNVGDGFGVGYSATHTR